MAAAELPLPSKCINTLSGHKGSVFCAKFNCKWLLIPILHS